MEPCLISVSYTHLDVYKRQVKACPECPKTACPSPETFKEAYEAADAEGVFVITLSGHLSGSYNSAALAKKLYEEEQAEKGEQAQKKQVAVIDSLSASSGELNIGLFIQSLCEAGLEFSQVLEKALGFRDRMHTYFVLESLDTCLLYTSRHIHGSICPDPGHDDPRENHVYRFDVTGETDTELSLIHICGTIDFIATAKKAGTFEGKVKVTYEDEAMEVRTMEIPVTFEVKEGAAEETSGFDGMDGEMDGGRGGDWKLPAGILTAALLAGVLWIKRKKSRGLNGQDRSQGQNGWDLLESGQEPDDWDLLEDGQEPDDRDLLEDGQEPDDRDEPKAVSYTHLECIRDSYQIARLYFIILISLTN